MSEVNVAIPRKEHRGRSKGSKKYFDSIDWTMNKDDGDCQKPHVHENIYDTPINSDAPSALAN